MSFKIVPLVKNTNSEKWKFLKAPLPHPPFRLMNYGSTGSGKTTAVLNLVLRFLVHPRTRLNIFDHIFVFTPSLTQDVAFRALADENLVDPSIIYASNELNKDLIQWLVNGCPDHDTFTDELDVRRDDNILILIDDFAGNKKKLADDILYDLFFRSRHANISTIINTQHYSNIPIQIRNNCSHMMIFRHTNNHEAMIIKQEQETADLNDDDFEEVYSDCTDEKYSFMYIDKSSGTPKFYKRFEYVVKLPERKNGKDKVITSSSSVVDVIKNDDRIN